jgi:hypothetical protein
MPLLLPLLISPEAVAQNQWNQLIAIIESEMNVGPTGPGSGTNPLGRLQKLYFCHQSIDMWSGLYPAAAVQLMEAPEFPVATHRHDIHSMFWIRLACASTPATAAAYRAPFAPGIPVPANLDDAMSQLKALISDGQGNGMSAVLRDRLNFNLKNSQFPNGLAYQTDITNWKYEWELDAGTDQQTVIAYATCMYTAKARIEF